MLVLRRKIGEEIKIGPNVVVKVLAVHGRSVRLGIEAPRTTPVWRGEWRGEEAEASSLAVPCARPN
jgi:carbon storage regulator